jgi:hypothetical protein
MDQLHILFQILKATGLDSPINLRKTLHGWDVDDRKDIDIESPIALRILNHILGPIKDGQLQDAVILQPRPFDSSIYVLMDGLADDNNFSLPTL